ncbi:SUMF1/EgtB/PvdO family nonheme iron enzyme [Limnobacter humi]|uniref:SUMF1/EgtB/PvdO family nonheme iron enzyme n=1 Tax=Limnobacter humi TaxID=1778671 RepID=A0ABT1WC24_9BURK|nr:selenoneine synthase SenA [Limnobacter humi]MCQ8895061.1 SUMF1/EgtB/PvdO family nonheme iron enzyme [Limnobacter humi]
MHTPNLSPDTAPPVYTSSRWQAAQNARCAGPSDLAIRLVETRVRTLGLLHDYAKALGEGLQVPLDSGLNPPLWEAGHIAWFQEWWVARNVELLKGVHCNPLHARKPAVLDHADALFNSSLVAHDTRWALAVGDLSAIQGYLFDTLQLTLQELARVEALIRAQGLSPAEQDSVLYFFRLVLFHEQMHNEAAVYMARQLDIPLQPSHAHPSPWVFSDPVAGPLSIPAGQWMLGWQGDGFAFDNELPSYSISLPAFEVDSHPVSWDQYLAFVEATGHALPARFQWQGGQLLEQRGGQAHPVSLSAAAVHLGQADALAYCAWAGRQLPTEAQWEYAVHIEPGLAWGEVWEWTVSSFVPFPGFVPHPYADYSAPWFGTRTVLKGACMATSLTMRHPKYRNYFTPNRTDIFAGFRTCATV